MGNKKLNEALKNLEEQGLVETDKKNPDLFKITKKGFEEVMRWREKNTEMDILLFTCNELKEKLKQRGELKLAHGDFVE